MVDNNKKESLDIENIGRRDFLCKSAMVCCMAGLPFPVERISRGKGQKPEGLDLNPAELGAYCGLYCGACDIYQKRIGQSGKELKKVLDAYEFSEIAEQIPGFEDYDTFYKVLNKIIFFFGQCPACRKGGGDPECKIRSCCQEKGYQTCAECPSAPCEKMKAISIIPFVTESLKEIKQTGYEKWCQKQQEKVNQGFRYSDIRIDK